MKTMRRAGFTLVELLVVLAIIAVLSAIAFPVLSAVKYNGYAARSSSNLHDLAAANNTYASDNNGLYCPAQSANNLVRWHGARTSASGTFDPTKGYLSAYLGGDGRVKIDPLFQSVVTGSQSFENGTGGYGYNEYYVGGTPAQVVSAGIYQPARRANIFRLAQTVMFTTSGLANGSGVQEYPFCEPPFWPDATGNPTGNRPTPSVHFRFHGQALVAWCDGHVTAETLQARSDGFNPYGGNASAQNLGWFGPDAENGFWNPARSAAVTGQN